MKKVILLRELRNNARHPISVISRKENIPVTTLYAVLSGMESGVIKKYVSLLGDGFCFYRELLLIEADTSSYKIRDFLANNPVVNNLYRTNKGFIAHVYYNDRKELNRIKRFLKNNGVSFSSHGLKELLFEEKFVPE